MSDASWEYKFLVGRGFRSRLWDGAGMDYGPLNEALLNRLSREGWEVCSHTYDAGSQPSLILKRRRVEAGDASDGRPETA